MIKLFFSFIFLLTFALAVFDEPVIGVFTIGMGQVTSVKNISGVNANPSISAYHKNRTAALLSGFSSSGSDEGQNIKFTAYGAAPVMEKLGVSAALDYSGLGGLDYPGVSGMLFTEIKICGGAGYKITENTAAGLMLKYQTWSLGINKTANSGLNFNITAGLYFDKISKFFSAGLYADNLLGGDYSSGKSGYDDKAPMKIIAGFSSGGDLIKELFVDITGIDISYNLNSSAMDINLGASHKIFQGKPFYVSAGIGILENFQSYVSSAGAGYEFGKIGVNYAARFPLTGFGGFGEHFAEVNYGF